MMFADNGVDVYSNALVVTDKYAKENGPLIKRFVRASLKGWEFTLKNPEEASRHPGETSDRRSTSLSMLANLKLIIDLLADRPVQAATGSAGWRRRKMADSVKIISQYRDIKVNMKSGDVYTNEFLTKIALPIPVK